MSRCCRTAASFSSSMDFWQLKEMGLFLLSSWVFISILSFTLALSFIWYTMNQIKKLIWQKLSDPVHW